MEELEKDFVPFDRALKLQEIGFNEPCIAWYYGKDLWMVDQRESAPINYRTNPIRGGNGVLAPTFNQVFRWFREKHNLNIIDRVFHDSKIPETTYAKDVIRISDGRVFKMERLMSYEEAELACLDKLLKIIESKSE